MNDQLEFETLLQVVSSLGKQRIQKIVINRIMFTLR